MSNTKSFDVYEAITNRIIEQLEKGSIPWRKPWVGTTANAISYTTRRPYSLLNQFLLEEPGEYITFKQVVALGGKVKKGAKSKMVVFYELVDTIKAKLNKETNEMYEVKDSYPVLKFYKVFHLSDTEGIKSKLEKPQTFNNEPIREAASIVEHYIQQEFNGGEGLVIDLSERDRACYIPSKDLIKMPMFNQFRSAEEYYSTLFHEMTHSTMIEKRCNRNHDAIVAKGDESYSKEELVAEIGSAMLINKAGIDSENVFDNSVGYIQAWLKRLKNDNKFIVHAASQAEKAVKYILGEYRVPTNTIIG